MRTRIKICGITRETDLAAAVEAGADAVGFVFHPASKRYLTPARAGQLRREVPAFVSAVALVVNAPQEDLRAIVEAVRPDLLQFHGDESAETCRAFCAPAGQRYLKAFRVGAPGLDEAGALAGYCAGYGDAAGWLFDSYSAGYGGSGLAFDHQLLAAVRADASARPLVLSGGLKPETVGQAVREVRPWAVDVSSGVETEPGIKSAERIRAFIDAVREADAA